MQRESAQLKKGIDDDNSAFFIFCFGCFDIWFE